MSPCQRTGYSTICRNLKQGLLAAHVLPQQISTPGTLKVHDHITRSDLLVISTYIAPLSARIANNFRMTYTIVAFLWRKPGTTPSEFKNHYENTHIPLLLSLMGPLFPLTHSRFYLRRHPEEGSSSATAVTNYQPTVYVGTHSDFDYDLYCTLEFEDEKGFDAFHQRMQDPEVAPKIAEDEEKFIDSQKLTVAAIHEPVITRRPS